jgi:hypothetical protein
MLGIGATNNRDAEMIGNPAVDDERKRLAAFMNERVDISNKRPKFDDAQYQESTCEDSPASSCRANDIIKLSFVDPFCLASAAVLTSCKPEYSHQLYEQEQVDLKSKDQNKIPSATVFIRCSDLAHHISTEFFADSEEKNVFLEQMKIGLPAESTTFRDIGERQDDAVSSDLLFDNSIEASHQPVGSLLNQLNFSGEEFELRLASHKHYPESTRLLRRAEKVAMWFIETADSVDFEDERWEIIILYQKKTDSSGTEYRLFGGYMTLFTFHNPFAGSKLRVCQALVLPHLQGKGMGREMLLAVYRIVAERPDVVEVTVEDPCPAFERLRDAVDTEWAMQLFAGRAAASSSTSGDDDKGVADVGAGYDDIKLQLAAQSAKTINAAELKEKLKLTTAQTNFAIECLQFAPIALAAVDTGNEVADVEKHSPEEYRVFRLAVKRRLLKDNSHLKAQPKDVMQKELDALFSEMLVRYRNVFKFILRQVQSRRDGGAPAPKI